jgi:hypothetical protein
LVLLPWTPTLTPRTRLLLPPRGTEIRTRPLRLRQHLRPRMRTRLSVRTRNHCHGKSANARGIFAS